MAYDPYSRIMKPDFQANADLPQWVPMDDNQGGPSIAQSTGSMVDLWKQRAARTPTASDPASRMPRMSEGQIASRAGAAANAGAGAPPIMPGIASKGRAGGMQSL